MKYLQLIAALIISAWFVQLGMAAMHKSDCNYAYATVQQIDANKHKYASYEDYVAARKPHREFYNGECIK